MKIGIFVSGFEPESGGGFTFESEVLRAILALAAMAEHQFCLLCQERDFIAMNCDSSLQSFEIVPVPSNGRLGRLVAGLESQSAFFRAHWRRSSALDKVAIASGVEFIWFIGSGTYKTDLPYLTVVWDLQHRVTPWFPEFSAKGIWDRRELLHAWFLQRATAIVTGTRVGQQELERYYQIPVERTLLLPHPTPRFALQHTEQEALVLPDEVRPPYILYPAQFWSHKNHVTLVKALTQIHKMGAKDMTLVLVGSDKGNKKFIQDVAREAGIQDAVVFLGFVSKETLVTLYRRAVALTYVSYCGPENMPPLEAFALGCPVIAARVPGADEQLGQNAILVQCDDANAVAEAVVKVQNDESLRAELISRGRRRAESWTAEHYVKEVFSFLDRFAQIRQSWSAR